MSEDRTADTVVSLEPRSARAKCPQCLARMVAVGPDPRVAATEVGNEHDLECENLRAAAKLIKRPPDREDQIAEAYAVLRAHGWVGVE